MGKSEISYGSLFGGVLKALLRAIGTLILLLLSVVFKATHVLSGKFCEILEDKLKK